MSNLGRIKGKIEQIEKLISEVKEELEILSSQSPIEVPKSRKKEIIPSEEELREEHERLYGFFMNQEQEKIHEFIKGKSKNYLKSFCRVNNVPLDTTKVSKDKISGEIIQWMAQRKAISQKIT